MFRFNGADIYAANGDLAFSYIPKTGDQFGNRAFAAAGSVENLKPGLVMEAFCRFLDADATQLKFALCRLEMYADSGDENARNLVTLESLGTVIE